MPAVTSAVHSNPAGLPGASTALVLNAGAPEIWKDGTYRAGLQTGNESFGVAGGLEKSVFGGDGHDPLVAYYGAGVRVQSLALGVAARTALSDGHGTRVNAGALFSATPAIDLGLTARGISGGVDEWGGGVRFGVSNGVDLVLDAAANSDLNGVEVKPGLKVGNESAAVTISYATGAREEFADGFSAGAGFRVGTASLLEFQYNAGGAFSKYFVSLAVSF